MATTLLDVKTFLSIPTTLTKYDKTIQSNINMAKKTVVDEGVGDTHDRYDDLVLLRTSILIAQSPLSALIKTNESDTATATGQVKKRRVADVDLEYFGERQTSKDAKLTMTNGDMLDLPGNAYSIEYNRLLKSVAGTSYMFA